VVGGPLATALLPASTLLARIEHMFDWTLDLVQQALAADKCSLMSLVPTTRELVIKKARGLDEAIIGQTRVKLGDGIAGWVALHQQAIVAHDAGAFPGLERRHAANYATPSFASVPILTEKFLGVLNAADKHDGSAFNSRDLRLLQKVASLTGELLSVQESIESLEEMSLSDPLTGLGSRRYFQRRLSQELARARRHGHQLSLLLIGIDRFNDLDSLYGHQVANRLLQRLGRSIERLIRRSDITTRYGGDEFAIILAQTSAEHAESAAKRITNVLLQESMAEIADQPAALSLSVGISCYPTLALDEEQLISQADAALRTAKSSLAGHIRTWREPTDRLLEAQRLGIPFLAAPVEMLSPEIARLIPLEIARQYCCVPVGHQRGKLTVAMQDPGDGELLRTLAGVTHLTIHPVISSQAEIITALNRLAELWGKVAAANIVIRKMPGRGREMKIAVKSLRASGDLGRIMHELTDTCHRCGLQIKSMETYLMIVTASTAGCSRLLKALRQIDDLLIDSVRTEHLQHPLAHNRA